jgi:hypothetical protein
MFLYCLFFVLCLCDVVVGEDHHHLRRTMHSPPRIQVAIVNAVQFHHEVYPALHHAWKRAGYDVTSYVNGGADLRLSNITTSWGFNFTNISSFNKLNVCNYKVIIFASVEYPLDFEMASHMVPSACRGQMNYVFVVHNPGTMRGSKERPSKLLQLVTENQNVQVIGLGPHTSSAISKILANNGHNRSTDYIIPLFPLDDSAVAQQKHSGFVMQGSISDARRNYKKMIASVAARSKEWPSDFKLVVLGKGTLDIPAEAAEFVQLRSGLAYPEYYGTIQRSLGVLTAFASNIYYREKTSSSVAASLICGTPLLTVIETVNVYSYLSESSVWLRNKEESDVEAMHRILSMDNVKEEFSNRYISLQTDIENAHLYNTATIDKIMSNI